MENSGKKLRGKLEDDFVRLVAILYQCANEAT